MSRYLAGLSFLAIALQFVPQPARADTDDADSLAGQPIYWKSGARIKFGDQHIPSDGLPQPLIATAVEGPWVTVTVELPNGSSEPVSIERSRVMTRERTLAYLAKRIERNPKKLDNWVQRIRIWAADQDSQKQLDDLTAAIRHRPDVATLFTMRALILFARKDLAAALKDNLEATRVDPKLSMAFNNAAWLQATATDESVRNGKEAVANATKACELDEWKSSVTLDTLAAAQAEAGDFESAVKTEQKAIDLLTIPTDKQGYRDRLKLYQERKPMRE